MLPNSTHLRITCDPTYSKVTVRSHSCDIYSRRIERERTTRSDIFSVHQRTRQSPKDFTNKCRRGRGAAA